MTRSYEDHFVAAGKKMAVIHLVSIVGLTARGVVFGVIALLLFFRFQSAGAGGEQPGLEEALAFVQGLPFGQALLAALGAGLVAFAAYSLAEARWRRIQSPAG